MDLECARSLRQRVRGGTEQVVSHCKKIDGKDFEKEHENVAYKAALSQRAARSEATVETLQKQREEQMRRKELAKEQALNVPRWSAVEA